jgi:signal transduction histidine kinase
MVNQEINRISRILQQMNQLCRPTIAVPQQVSLRSLLQEVIESVTAQCSPKNVQVAVEQFDAEETEETRLCELEFRQIIHNLMLNAFEASPDGSTVQINLWRSSPRQLAVAIRDRGEGIPHEQLPHIFEPFFTTKSDYRRAGSGLGLAISRSLAQALGGTIEVETQLGHGSRFTLIIPTEP